MFAQNGTPFGTTVVFPNLKLQKWFVYLDSFAIHTESTVKFTAELWFQTSAWFIAVALAYLQISPNLMVMLKWDTWFHPALSERPEPVMFLAVEPASVDQFL